MLFKIVQSEKDPNMAHTIEVLAIYADFFHGLKQSYVSSKAVCQCHFHDGSIKGAIVWMSQIEEFVEQKGYVIEVTPPQEPAPHLNMDRPPPIG